MKEIQKLLAEAARFKEKRAALVRKYKETGERFQQESQALDADHNARVKSLEAEREASLALIEDRAKKAAGGYIAMKNSLHDYLGPVKQWCPQDRMRYYTPDPNRVNEAELNQLIHMLREQGFIAWVKRTLRIGGYASRAEMAYDLCAKIEDGSAYCDERVREIERRAEAERSDQLTDSRRKRKAEQERYLDGQKRLGEGYNAQEDRARKALEDFDASAELKTLRERLERRRAQAESFCGVWGEYRIPTQMPERIPLCEAVLTLPNAHGIDEAVRAPLWLELYETNIVVITTRAGLASHGEGTEGHLVRQLLARMLKTVPPENCSYSVFDALRKGASLSRLIDVTNFGTTDLNFEVFANEKKEADAVSCAERRQYLRHRPAEIIKSTAGHSKSLYEHVRQSGSFDFPFSWIIDFHFPEDPDQALMEDMKDLFVNAGAAGYSFVFVTTQKGLGKLRELAERCTNTRLLHIDTEKGLCSAGEISFSWRCADSPAEDQIGSFMSAMKRFYDSGSAIDNGIAAVFAAKGLDMRSASRKLTIPMALDSRGRLVDLELGGEGSVHGFVSGGTNSGKSTLLHTIILSACLHYHPRDLEIWLVDYKQTEFHLYKEHTPPHIKLIGVSKTPDFTFSLLDKIQAEADRRTRLMNLFNAQNLEEYRKHAAEPGYENIPRLFILIDEFHEMSQFVAGEAEYKDKLENILREYRAQGVTCLLADQTFSTGLGGLSAAAKMQIGLRIAMRNESSSQEVRDTLEVDRAMYSDNMQHTIATMSQGEFIMKVYVRNGRGDLTDIRLEKFKGLLTKGEDIPSVGKALRAMYKGQYSKELLYVNTTEQVPWDEAEPAALDRAAPIRYPNIRLYLGRSATLQPCFGLDMGRQPNENLAIVGGAARQRWELLSSVMQSCRRRGYRLLVFMAEYSDLMSDHGFEIRRLCAQIPKAEIMESTADWCRKLSELSERLEKRQGSEDTVCVFIGLEIANIEFGRLPDRAAGGAEPSFDDWMKYLTPVDENGREIPARQTAEQREFNALPIIQQLFSSGARNGIRCVAEVSVYRQFDKLLRLPEMCRHRIAFSMSADDCLMYLGSSGFQKSIGQNAVYSDGGKEVKKLIPYELPKEE